MPKNQSSHKTAVYLAAKINQRLAVGCYRRRDAADDDGERPALDDLFDHAVEHAERVLQYGRSGLERSPIADGEAIGACKISLAAEGVCNGFCAGRQKIDGEMPAGQNA